MSWADYERAVARVHTPDGAIELRPMPHQAAGPYPRVGDEEIHVITAYNPNGRVQSEDSNLRAHALLIAEVSARSLTFYEAEGGDAAWEHVELSLAVIGMSDSDAIHLGRLFNQEAIFKWTRSAWILLDCTTGNSVTSGFVSEFDAAARTLQASGAALGLDRPLVDLKTLDRSLEKALTRNGDGHEGASTVRSAHSIVRQHVTDWRDQRRKQATIAAEFLSQTEAYARQAAEAAAAEAAEHAARLREAAPGQGHANILQRCVARGLDPAEAHIVATLGVDPDLVTGDLADAMPFLRAADHHGLDPDTIEGYLDVSKGDSQEAWEIWAEDEQERETRTDEDD